MGSLSTGRSFAVAMLLAVGGANAALADTAAPVVTPPPAAAAPATTPDPAVWQAVITGQVEAFRKGDAPTAFSFAGTAFQKTFQDAATFMVSIAASGYSPIFTSVSHSFGKFAQTDPQTVVQEVTFVGPKQEVYEAVYVLALEPSGWRVQGVQLTKSNALAV